MAATKPDFVRVLDLSHVPIAPNPLLPPRILLPEHTLWLKQHEYIFQPAGEVKGFNGISAANLVQDFTHDFLDQFFPWLTDAQHRQFHDSHWKVSRCMSAPRERTEPL